MMIGPEARERRRASLTGRALAVLLALLPVAAGAVDLQDRRLNPELPADAAALALIARPIPEAFASYPVMAMQRSTTVTIDDWAVVPKGEGGGGRPAWVREWHALDRIQHPSGMGHTNFAFPYPAGHGTVLVPERRRIRADGSYVRTTVHEMTDGVVASSDREARYGAYRQKKLTIKDVAPGDFVEIATRSTSEKKMGPAGYGETYRFGTMPALEERICFQRSAKVPLRWRLDDAENSVQVLEDRVEVDGVTLDRTCFERRDGLPEIVEDDAPKRVYRTPVLRVTTWESWDDYGRWLHGKLDGRLDPDDEIRALVRGITAGLEGEDAIRAVFHWVTENIHYVLVRLETDSGWIPSEATEVLERRYGDCKDQTTLLIAMLDAIGVEAQPVLVATTGTIPAALELPMMYQFDHMITWLPAQGIFLDPVGDDVPFPYLLPMDQDRDALVLDGKRLVPTRTPWMPPEASRRTKTRKVTLLMDQASEGLVEYRYEAVNELIGQSSAAWHRRRGYSQERLVDYLAHTWIDEGILEDYGFDHPLDDFGHPVVVRTTHRFEADDVAWNDASAPSVVMLPPLLGIPDASAFYHYPERAYPFTWLDHPQVREERWEVTIPAGYRLAWLPEDVHHDDPSGLFSYEATFSQDDEGRLLLYELLEVTRPVLEAEEFRRLRPTILELSRKVENRLVLVPVEDQTSGAP